MGLNFIEIVERIRVYLEKKYGKRVFDQDIANTLGITKQHFSKSKRENMIPLSSIVDFCAKEKLVINYILYNQAPESLIEKTDNLITVKYFKHINSSAGGGAFNYEDEYANLSLDDEIVHILGGKNNIKNIESINVVGDSMEPIIKDGAIIFVDRSKCEIKKDKKEIYVINTAVGILVKYLDLTLKNELKLISANPSYEPEVISLEEVTIIGKVVGVVENV